MTALEPARWPLTAPDPDPEPEPDPFARRLVAALERENDLLNQVSVAHSGGWAAAVDQTRALLRHAFDTAPRDAATGLAAALLIVEGLATRRPPAAAHRLDAAIVPGLDSPEYRIRCTAAPAAACRQACEGALTGDCAPARGCVCDGALVDADHCLAAADLVRPGPAGEADLFAAYAGISRPVESGPILVRREPGGWSWLYAADLPDEATARAWTDGGATP